MTMINDVRQFHRHFGHPVSRVPHFLTVEREKFRLDLIDEEANKELRQALEMHNFAMVGDAIADSIYVLIGFALEMGLPLEAIWDAVQRANMRKAVCERHMPNCALAQSVPASPARCSCGAVEYTATGKTAKPRDWVGPDAEIEYEISKAVTSNKDAIE